MKDLFSSAARGRIHRWPGLLVLPFLLLAGCRSSPAPLERPDSVVLAERTMHQAARLARASRWEEAAREWRRAAEQLALLNDRRGEGQAWQELAAAERMLGRNGEASNHLALASSLHLETKARADWWLDQLALAQLELAQGATNATAARLQMLSAEWASTLPASIRGLFANEWALASLRAGNADEAERRLATALDAFRAADDPFGQATALANRAFVACWRKDWPTARQRWQDALTRFESVGDAPGIARCLAGLGEAQWRSGSPAEAERNLRRAGENFQRLGDKEEVRRIAALVAEFAGASGIGPVRP